jgi:hypothetical protein
MKIPALEHPGRQTVRPSNESPALFPQHRFVEKMQVPEAHPPFYLVPSQAVPTEPVNTVTVPGPSPPVICNGGPHLVTGSF